MSLAKLIGDQKRGQMEAGSRQVKKATKDGWIFFKKQGKVIDLALIPKGVQRCSLKVFLPWTPLWLAILAWGLVSAYLCLYKGLNQANMNHRFAFGLWIVLDLSLIALGAGAFFTGFLVHIIGRDELKAIITPAVVVGFSCYSAAIAILLVDIG